MTEAFYKNRAKKLFRSALEADRVNEWSSNLKILSELADDAILKLLSELIERNKFLGIKEIAAEYTKLLEEHLLLNSTEDVLITTAVPLDEERIDEMKRKFSEIRVKPIVLRTEVDPSLIGGMTIKIGEQVIDGSVRNKLQVLKSKIGKIHG